MKPVFIFLVLCGSIIAGSSAQLTDNSESATPGREFSQATTLIYRYTKAHNGALPKNWSDVWDAKDVAWNYRYLAGRPLVQRQVAFVDPASQLTADGSGTRIIAITRAVVSRPFGEKKKGDQSNEPVWIDHRLIVFQTKDGKLLQGSVKADQPLRGVNLDHLVLKDPDLTNKQVADTVAAMIEDGFSADQIWTAFGADAIEAVQKSGLLDPLSQKVLNEKPPQLVSTPTIAASTPRPSATATPTENRSSSGFPIVPVVILAAVIAGAAAVFVLRRRSV